VHAFPMSAICLSYSGFFCLHVVCVFVINIDREEECNVDMDGAIVANLNAYGLCSFFPRHQCPAV
jgi:hypothetical protein